MKSNKSSSNLNKSWYALYVMSRHEMYVFDILKKKGIECSLPTITINRQWSDRKKKIKSPLFKGYLFVKICFKKDALKILQSKGVVNFVKFRDKPMPIPDKEMYWLDKLIESEIKIKPEKIFPIGSDVSVFIGPLKGLNGKIVQKKSKQKLVIWFDSIMQGVSVIIDNDQLSIN